jgi:uncharacterized protein YbjT (DUF2867 family)
VNAFADDEDVFEMSVHEEGDLDVSAHEEGGTDTLVPEEQTVSASENERPHIVAVAGATGTLGGYLVPRLVAHGLRVRVLARDAGTAGHLMSDSIEVVPGDVRDRESVVRGLAGCDAVVSAFTAFGRPAGGDLKSADLEGNIHLIEAAKKAATKHFVLVSLHGAAPDSPLELGRIKYQVEERLKRSDLSWTIIRPTPSMEIYTKLLGEPLIDAHKTRVFGRGDNPINFVSQRDIAAFIVLALEDPALRGQVIDVGGPDNLTVNELLARFKALTGASGSEQHVPRVMLRAMSVVMRPISPMMARMARSAVEMDIGDMAFDDGETARRYPSIHPTSLEEVVREEYPKAA